MITVRVKVLGALAKPLGRQDFALELDDGSSLEDLLLEAGYRREHLRSIACAVDGVQARLGHRLSGGEEVSLMLLAGGG
jgi:molybdopterin converting factor small subunit